jgi:phosphate transport system protein
MILKMNNDFERIGDHAVNICQRVLALMAHSVTKLNIDIPRMAYEAINMLNDGVRSFVDEDARLAKSVCERDSVVDDLRDQIVRKLISCMIKKPSAIERSIHLLEISKNLERVADLSTNICEDVIYLVDGRVIKHHHEE